MSVRTDVINLNVNINGDAAKDQLNRLRTDAAKITAEMKSLKKGTDEWIKKNEELRLINDKIRSLRSEIGLTALSQRELVAELKRLQMMKMNLTPQTKEFRDLQNQIDAVQNRLREVRTGEFGFKSFWSSMSNEVKQFGMLAAGYLGFDFVIGQSKNLIQMQSKMADEYSNIEKTTSLTKDQIKDLDQELRKFDTRSSDSRLRQLGAEAGKLGKDGVEDIRKFVEQADKIDVALGEDLGDDGLTKIAKISGILNEQMINIASGINAVGAASAASEGYQVDFAFRMAGTAQTARMAAGDLFGYAAALEVNGQTAEVSGTAMSTFLLDFIANTESFGKAAGYAKGELVEMINGEGVNAAFLAWLQKLKDSSKTQAEFIQKMTDVGIDGARGAGVFLVLANNIEQVKQQQDLANKAVAEGTSVLEEFDTKNNNFAATVDKLKKEFTGFFTSEAVENTVKKITEVFIDLLNGFKGTIEWIDKNRLAVIAWGTALIIQTGIFQKLVAWIGLQALGLKNATSSQILNTIATRADIAVTRLAVAAKSLLTLKLSEAKEAMQKFFRVLGLNPWAAILIGIGALLVAFNSLISKTAELNTSQKLQIDLDKRVVDSTSEKITKVNQWVKAINNENTSSDHKRRLMEQLIAMDPVLLKGLTQKNIATAQGKRILDEYIKSLKNAAKAESLLALQKENLKEIAELDIKWGQLTDEIDKMSVVGQFWDAGKAVFGGGKTNELIDTKRALDAAKERQKEIDKRVSENTDVSKVLIDDKNLAGGDLKTPKEKKKGKSEEEKAAEKAEKEKRQELEKLVNELKKIQEDIEKKSAEAKESLSAMHTFELQDLTTKYAERMKIAMKHGQEYVKLVGNISDQELTLLSDKQRKEMDKANYADSLKNLEIYTNSVTNILKKQYADGLIDKKTYEKELKLIEADEFEGRLSLAQHFAENVKEAATEAEKLKTEEVERGIKERVEAEEKAQKSALAFLRYQIAAAPEGSEKQLEFRKRLLEEERRIRIENEMLTQEELVELDQEYKDKMNELDYQYWSKKAEMIISAFQKLADILGGIFSVIDNKEQKQLQDAEARDKRKKTSLERRLAAGTITQVKYDKAIATIESQADAREKKFQIEKAKRNKATAIFNAVISTAQAVVGALGSQPWGVWNIALAAMMGVMGGVQIAAISSEPLPRGRKGLIIQGPSHEAKGIDMVNGQTGERIANIEGGEPVMVLSKRTYANNKETIDALIESSQYKNGAKIRTQDWYMAPFKPFNPGIVNAARSMPAMSDEVYSASGRAGQERMQQMEQRFASTDALMAEMIEEQRLTRAAILKDRNRRSYVVLKDMEEAQRRKDRAKMLSGIR